MNSSQQKVKQFMDERIGRLEEGMDHLQDRDYPVSYTHLDVYKRQPFGPAAH